jgi:hypothetical protein
VADDETARLTAALVATERENHRLLVALDQARCERDQAEARARTWRRVAQWIHAASQATEET